MDPSVVLAKRYIEILEGSSVEDPFKENERLCHGNLVWLCTQIITFGDYPIDKVGRWLGFVQGVMAAQGLIDVDEERNFSRPLFHNYYREQGINIPVTAERLDTDDQ